VIVHTLNSPRQSGPTEVRVLRPDRLEAGVLCPVLFVLPVEANREARFGDGLAEIQRQNLHNTFQLICVAPTFSQLPWYADHPTDPMIQQESYLVNEVLPLVERHHPVGRTAAERWLLGFSKSGYGAWSLLVRHPEVFGYAAAWDAPLDMPRYDQYGAGAIYGSQQHFEKYQILPALVRAECLKQSGPRLILTGYGNFRPHHQTAHGLLTEQKIAHVYRDGPERKHVWESGWVAESVELLATTARSATTASPRRAP